MTAAQLGLRLGPQGGRDMPPHVDRDTSREAARRIVEHASRLERLYLEALYEAGDAGLIDHEAKRWMHCALTTVQPRRADLNERGPKLVEASEARRPSPSGRPCIVWVLTEAGRAVAERLGEPEREA